MNNENEIQKVYNEIFHPVDVKNGALKGRPNIGEESIDAKGKKIYRRRVHLFACKSYDKGGVYWGSGKFLYVRFTLDKSFVQFIRE